MRLHRHGAVRPRKDEAHRFGNVPGAQQIVQAIFALLFWSAVTDGVVGSNIVPGVTEAPLVSEWKYAVGAEYKVPLGATGTLTRGWTGRGGPRCGEHSLPPGRSPREGSPIGFEDEPVRRGHCSPARTGTTPLITSQ